jgi:RND superfamily putative drug exporter
LADGVQTLVDKNKQMALGLKQAAGLLLTIKQDASQPSMAGMYIPPEVLTTNDVKNAAKFFMSPDGHSTRYLVQTKFDAFSTAAMDQVQTILDTTRGAQPNTTLSDATISMLGTTAMYSTIRGYYDDDLRLIIVLTLVVVFLILVALLRAIVAPLYLIASVVISYLSALGLGVAFFQFICHQHICWSVPAIAFIVLVAVGADYNLLLTLASVKSPAMASARGSFVPSIQQWCDHLGRNHLRCLDVRPAVRQCLRWCKSVSSSGRAC